MSSLRRLHLGIICLAVVCKGVVGLFVLLVLCGQVVCSSSSMLA
jgi:hypothetical protein